MELEQPKTLYKGTKYITGYGEIVSFVQDVYAMLVVTVRLIRGCLIGSRH